MQLQLTEKQISAFNSKVKVCANGCHEWQGYVRKDGYGSRGVNYKNYLAHRISYFINYIEIPDNLEIDHLCRNRKCVNPIHLEAVPKQVNQLRGINTYAADAASRTHCHKGHEYNQTNTRIRPDGWRQCRICQNESRTKIRQPKRPDKHIVRQGKTKLYKSEENNLCV